MIPSVCRAAYDRRLLTGETAEDVLGAITSQPALADIQLNAVIGEGRYEAYTGKEVTMTKFFPAWELPENDVFVQAALQGVAKAGLELRTRAYRFCTNAAYSAGVAGVPTIGFGPGEESDAHIVDERLRIEDLLAAARGYRAIAEAVLA